MKADCRGGQQHDIISIQEDTEGEGRQVGAVEMGAARGMLLQISGNASKKREKRQGLMGHL